MARATGVELRALRCAGKLAVIRILPGGTSPLDVELREPGDGAFRVIGDFGLSPIVEVADYGDLPGAQRDAFEALAAQLERSPDDAGDLLGAPLVPVAAVVNRTRTWPPLLLLALLALALAGRAPGTRSSRRTWLSLFAVALSLRALFGLWGPLHVNGQGALWVSGVLESSRLSIYGPGYAEFFGWTRGLQRIDLAIFGLNCLLGAAMAPLTFRLGEVLRLRPKAALAAGLVVALDPVGVRIAASESYLLPVGAMLLLTYLSLAGVASRWERRDRRGAVLLSIAAALLTAQVARTHPVSWLPAALAPLLVWSAPGGWRPRLMLTLATALALGAATLVLSGDAVWAGLAQAQEHGRSVTLAPLWASPIWIAVALLGAWLWRARAEPGRLLPVVVLAAAILLVTRHVYGQSALWMASLARLYLPLLVLGAACLWPARAWGRRGSWAVVGVSVLFLLARFSSLWSPLTTRTTEQREYAFVADQLAAAPSGCWVASVRSAQPRVLTLPTYRVPLTQEGRRSHYLDVQSAGDLSALALRTDCLIYVHSSICQSAEGSERCRQVERGTRLTPLVSEHFPAVPSYDDLPYDARQVEVSLFRVEPATR